MILDPEGSSPGPQDTKESALFGILKRTSARFARSLGVEDSAKKRIYVDVALAAAMRDAPYWLQTIFSAGIATLGLVLNSPAVIIGAMLISPLIGTILSGGLALATGDLILGVRSGLKLALSCLVAIFSSVVLVGMLPFKELTNEIASRTRPNLLDLGVALFSGAVGSIAICREVRGVVTSIPGVAIAVALMPPLGVVGYGLGLGFSSNAADGLLIARGGGLLFLTNLVAITFTAMLVFLAIGIDTGSVRRGIEEWYETDQESQVVLKFFDRIHVSEKVRQVGGFRGRFLVIVVPLLLLLVPLGRSLNELQQEYTRLREDNQVRLVVSNIWQAKFAKFADGKPRSELDQIVFLERAGQITVSVRDFTSDPLTAAERSEFADLIAAGLGRSIGTVQVEIQEIPTTAGLLAARSREPRRVETPPPTVQQLRAGFEQGVQTALQTVRFPPNFHFVGHRVSLAAPGPMQIELLYLGGRDIDEDAKELIRNDVRNRLTDTTATVLLRWLPDSILLQPFPRNDTTVGPNNIRLLDEVAVLLRDVPSLDVEVLASGATNEASEVADARAKAVIDYFVDQHTIARERFTATPGQGAARTVVVTLRPPATTR